MHFLLPSTGYQITFLWLSNNKHHQKQMKWPFVSLMLLGSVYKTAIHQKCASKYKFSPSATYLIVLALLQNS